MDDPYRMKNKSRGKCIVFNNKIFPKSQRSGTDTDAKNVENLFEDLGFVVEILNDKTANEMKDKLVEESKSDHRNLDCFICVILSYGEDGIVYGSDAEEIEIEKLIEPLKGNECPSLIGKPKLFIIQSCKEISGEIESDALAACDQYDEQNVQTIPAEADILYVCSLVPGSLTWNKPEEGSLFIDILSRVFKQYGKKKDILWLLTKINHEMAFKLKSVHGGQHKCKVPLVVSMLTKDLIFTEK